MFLSLVLLSCSTPEPKKEEPKKPASSCDVTVDSLKDSVWVYQRPQAAGPDKPDPMARVRFREEGGVTKADYTAGSTGSVYHYDCKSDGKVLTCLENNAHADAFCKAYAAVHDGVCDAAAVSAATGLPLADVEKTAEKVNAELAKLKGEEKDQQRKSDNSPNNKIRGKFLAAVNAGTCQLTLQDKYQTMVDGKLNEFENVIGAGKFSRTKEDYVFDGCEDADSAWAPDASDQHQIDQAPGTIKFSAILQKDQKGAAGCSYSADIYKDYVKSQSDVPAGDDKKYGPRWDVSIPFSDAGKHVVFFDRYKTCDGKKDRIGMTCVLVKVGG